MLTEGPGMGGKGTSLFLQGEGQLWAGAVQPAWIQETRGKMWPWGGSKITKPEQNGAFAVQHFNPCSHFTVGKTETQHHTLISGKLGCTSLVP